MLSCLSLINSYFDQWHVRKHVAKTTHSSIVELNQNNCRRKNCQTSQIQQYKVYEKYILCVVSFKINGYLSINKKCCDQHELTFNLQRPNCIFLASLYYVKKTLIKLRTKTWPENCLPLHFKNCELAFSKLS